MFLYDEPQLLPVRSNEDITYACTVFSIFIRGDKDYINTPTTKNSKFILLTYFMIYCKCNIFIVGVVAESFVLLLPWLLIPLLVVLKFTTTHHHMALSSTNHKTPQRPKKSSGFLLEVCNNGAALLFISYLSVVLTYSVRTTCLFKTDSSVIQARPLCG